MAEFIKIVKNNLLINWTVSKDDIKIAEDIWGPNLGSLKGKTTIQKPIQLRESILPTPFSISQKYKQITICADATKVKTIPFLLYISKHL